MQAVGAMLCPFIRCSVTERRRSVVLSAHKLSLELVQVGRDERRGSEGVKWGKVAKTPTPLDDAAKLLGRMIA
jgi:hypothetical protein